MFPVLSDLSRVDEELEKGENSLHCCVCLCVSVFVCAGQNDTPSFWLYYCPYSLKVFNITLGNLKTVNSLCNQ